MELTETDRKVLEYMFRSFSGILEFDGGGIRVDYEWFSTNDLFKLAEKLGIDY